MAVGAKSAGGFRTTASGHYIRSEGAYLAEYPKPTKQRLDSKHSEARHVPWPHRCRQGDENSAGEIRASSVPRSSRGGGTRVF